MHECTHQRSDKWRLWARDSTQLFVNSVTSQLVPRHNWSPGPSAANYVAIDGPPDQVWLPWMVRFAASGPPLASRHKVDKNLHIPGPIERSDCLVKAPYTFVAMANEWSGPCTHTTSWGLSSDWVVLSSRLPYFSSYHMHSILCILIAITYAACIQSRHHAYVRN